jgi:hypothetical protein
MTPSTPITPIIIDTVLGHLAIHFMSAADNDLPAARHAASRILACHAVETEEELQLAADIISFGFHVLEALSEAADRDLSVDTRIRLRASAVSLSRESHRARRKLDQLQRARLTPAAQPTEQPAPQNQPLNAETKPDAEPPAGLMELAREAIQACTKKGRVQTWTQTRQQRRQAQRAAENIRRTNAEQARRDAKSLKPTIPQQPTA